MKYKKLLITGNLGYVGSAVVEQLRKSYSESNIVGVDSGYFAHCVTDQFNLPEIRLDQQLFMDVRKVSDSILEGIDAIVYLAAISNDAMGKQYAKQTMDINCSSAMSLAKRAQLSGVKSFVFASSCSVYGKSETDINEASALNPLTEYALSKVSAEMRLKSLANPKFQVTCLRFATACGMSKRMRLDLVLNDLILEALLTKKIRILSDGTPWRPLIHIKDMALAIDWAVKKRNNNGSNYLVVNVGSNKNNFQVIQLAEAIKKTMPKTEIVVNKNALPDKRSYKVNFDLFAKLAPDYVPKFSLLTAVEELTTGLERIVKGKKRFDKSDYCRLKELNKLQNAGLLNQELYWNFN